MVGDPFIGAVLMSLVTLAAAWLWRTLPAYTSPRERAVYIILMAFLAIGSYFYGLNPSSMDEARGRVSF